MRCVAKYVLPLSYLMAPHIAHANAGVPMLALAWPVQWLAFVPIVLLECELLRRPLQLSFRQMLWPITKANLISTLVGVPVAWVAMLTPLMVVGFGFRLLPTPVTIPSFVEVLLLPLTAAWVTGSSPWRFYFAFVVLTIPFCLVSIFLEEGVLRKKLPDQDHSTIHFLTVRANVWSYALLSVLAVAFPLMA